MNMSRLGERMAEAATLRDKIRAEKQEKVERQEGFHALVTRAVEAGNAAFAAATPVPMVVQEHTNPLGDLLGGDAGSVVNEWHVPEGVCGFAWITLYAKGTDGRRFVNYLTGTQKPARADLAPPVAAKKAYGGGFQVWVHSASQSLARKEAYAQAFANVIREANIEGLAVYAGSRMD